MRYRLLIAPVRASGVGDTFIGLIDGYALGKHIGIPARLPFRLGAGPTGFWPLSIPLPVNP